MHYAEFTNHTESILSILSHYNIVGAADGNTGAYKAATGVSLAIAIVMLLALVFVIISAFIWHKHRGIGEETLSILTTFHAEHQNCMLDPPSFRCLLICIKQL